MCVHIDNQSMPTLNQIFFDYFKFWCRYFVVFIGEGEFFGRACDLNYRHIFQLLIAFGYSCKDQWTAIFSKLIESCNLFIGGEV